MLLFIDGFDHNDDTTGASYSKWSVRNGWSVGSVTANLRFGVGTGQYQNSGATDHHLERSTGSNLAAGAFGVAFKQDASGTNLYQRPLFVLYDGTSVQCFVIQNTDRTLSICRGTTANVLGTTTYQVPTAVYVYLEWKWKIDNSVGAGDVQLYADGVSILSLAAASDTQVTANAYATKYRLGGDSAILAGAGRTTAFIDDHYFIDFTGSFNNAVLGSVRVSTIFPNGNGNSSQFVNSASTSTNNSTYVDDTTPNSDTDYVQSDTVGNKDTYAFGDTPLGIANILGVAINLGAKRSNVDPRSLCGVTRMSTTDYDTANVALNTSYTNHQLIMERRPSDSNPWTKSDVDAAEFGVKVTV